MLLDPLSPRQKGDRLNPRPNAQHDADRDQMLINCSW